MILIGESINIMSKTIGPALRERRPEPIQEMAKAEVETGIDYLDLNIGPARRSGDELMQWVVKTVQDVTDRALSLDTTNPVAMEAGLKVCRGKALINSVSLQPDRLEAGLPMVKKYNASMIGLLWGKEGMPRDANERCLLAVDLLYKTNEMGIPNEDIWIDPIASPVSVEINQVKSCVEFMSMLAEIAPGCKSTVGLSNISNGTPAHLRPYLNRAYLIMLMRYGLYSAIVDAFDAELVKIAKGEMPEIVDLVWRVMDGDRPNIASLSKKEAEYVKTVRVLTGESLYSHSWLEI
ncbi:MAG: 5-methyltetrahydrofolate:corrinoid iron-sulfur protein methyltransferase [Dehalococcoidales bacterium]|nr:5-methyltetrahydrofolate:corrinoid iron-sulfur protein methyltransferase [Dehalococcoidales bacterium]